jgi:hypothetical protein
MASNSFAGGGYAGIIKSHEIGFLSELVYICTIKMFNRVCFNWREPGPLRFMSEGRRRLAPALFVRHTAATWNHSDYGPQITDAAQPTQERKRCWDIRRWPLLPIQPPESQSVRVPYQPPASSTFLSQQTSNQPAVLFSQTKSASTISRESPRKGSLPPDSFPHRSDYEQTSEHRPLPCGVASDAAVQTRSKQVNVDLRLCGFDLGLLRAIPMKETGTISIV